MLGSAAVDLVWLASGRLDASVTMGDNAWDMAAGVVIAREAGALVLDADGTEHTTGSAATVAVSLGDTRRHPGDRHPGGHTAARLTALSAIDEHVEVEATWGIYQLGRRYARVAGACLAEIACATGEVAPVDSMSAPARNGAPRLAMGNADGVGGSVGRAYGGAPFNTAAAHGVHAQVEASESSSSAASTRRSSFSSV